MDKKIESKFNNFNVIQQICLTLQGDIISLKPNQSLQNGPNKYPPICIAKIANEELVNKNRV